MTSQRQFACFFGSAMHRFPEVEVNLLEVCSHRLPCPQAALFMCVERSKGSLVSCHNYVMNKGLRPWKCQEVLCFHAGHHCVAKLGPAEG